MTSRRARDWWMDADDEDADEELDAAFDGEGNGDDDGDGFDAVALSAPSVAGRNQRRGGGRGATRGSGGGSGAAGGRGRGRGRIADDADVEDEDLAYRTDLEHRERERRRAGISEEFKCRNCRNFIGTPPSGGSQRNHCPLCLFSLHVDGKTPGDRASDCHSLMEPIGVFYRVSNLEQMVVHRCRGCGFVRYNRVAADDNPVLLGRLPVIDPATLPSDSGE